MVMRQIALLRFREGTISPVKEFLAFPQILGVVYLLWRLVAFFVEDKVAGFAGGGGIGVSVEFAGGEREQCLRSKEIPNCHSKNSPNLVQIKYIYIDSIFELVVKSH
ncbi:hypothetical protein ACP275_04G005100 [Erythranthe tilingii]